MATPMNAAKQPQPGEEPIELAIPGNQTLRVRPLAPEDLMLLEPWIREKRLDHWYRYAAAHQLSDAERIAVAAKLTAERVSDAEINATFYSTPGMVFMIWQTALPYQPALTYKQIARMLGEMAGRVSDQLLAASGFEPELAGEDEDKEATSDNDAANPT